MRSIFVILGLITFSNDVIAQPAKKISTDQVIELIYTQGQHLIEPRTGLSVRKLLHDALFAFKSGSPCIDSVRLRPSIQCQEAGLTTVCKVSVATDQSISLILDMNTKDKRSGKKVSVLGSPEALALDDFFVFDLTIIRGEDTSLVLSKVDNFTSAGGGTEYGETCGGK